MIHIEKTWTIEVDMFDVDATRMSTTVFPGLALERATRWACDQKMCNTFTLFEVRGGFRESLASGSIQH
jgi:hypothetical protein